MAVLSEMHLARKYLSRGFVWYHSSPDAKELIISYRTCEVDLQDMVPPEYEQAAQFQAAAF